MGNSFNFNFDSHLTLLEYIFQEEENGLQKDIEIREHGSANQNELNEQIQNVCGKEEKLRGMPKLQN